MKTKKYEKVVYFANEVKPFYCFSSFLSKYTFLLSEDGYSILLKRRLFLMLILHIKSKTILESEWFKKFTSRSELNDEVNIEPTFFLIEMTNNCNLNCKYCFRGEHTNRKISYEMLDKILESISKYILKKSIKNFSIQPWGGEPTLEIDKIIYIRNYFDNINLHPTITCETNGILLTPDYVKKMLINDIDFGVSVDGISKIHDFNRPLANFDPSSKIIFKNLKYIKENYPELRISGITTNTMDSLLYVNENINFLINDLGFKNLKMNFVKDNPFMSKEITPFSKESLSLFYKKVYTIVKKVSKVNKEISEGNISVRALNLLYRSSNDICSSHGCRGGRKMFAFDVEGKIYNCEMIGENSQFLGNYYDDFDEIIRKSIQKNPYFKDKRKEECKNCPYQYFCMGGCGSICIYEKKDDEYTCTVNKTLYPLLIKDILKKSSFINLYRRRKH